MPDYAACCESECPLRNRCARYRMVKSKDRQSVVLPERLGEDCSLFWDVDQGVPFALNEQDSGH